VWKQQLAQWPRRGQPDVDRERIPKSGEGAQGRGLVAAGCGIVADGLLQQAVHADAVVIDDRETEARQCVECIGKALAPDRCVRVDEHHKQRLEDRVRPQVRGHLQRLCGQRSIRARRVDRGLPGRRDGLRVGQLGMTVEQLASRQLAEQLQVVRKARAALAVRGRVRQRERQAAKRPGELARGALVAGPADAVGQVCGRGVLVKHIDREHGPELAQRAVP
jgi:hypothetical protein